LSEFLSDNNFSLTRKSHALQTRARLIQCIRDFFIHRDFLEVETPVRIPSPAPEEHIEAIRSEDWFLQTSPELAMKRMLAAGYPRIFQISKCFRAGERGRLHLPEYTMLEWYVAGFDYRELMNQCEGMIWSVTLEMSLEAFVRQDRKIQADPPWERVTVAQAFSQHAPMSVEEALAQDNFDEMLVEHIEPKLGFNRPTFLYDYPAELASLARLKEDNQSVGERFELYIGGLEIANGFSELTDANEQRKRFEEALKKRAAKNRARYDMPEKFLRSLDDLPPCAGIALGVDRLVMLCTGADRIDDVVAFTPDDL
jgi:lysyl-tRNA synthetase class 2